MGEQPADGVGDVAAAGFVALGHHDLGTLLGEPTRNGRADAGTGAGDQRHLAVQLTAHAPLLTSRVPQASHPVRG